MRWCGPGCVSEMLTVVEVPDAGAVPTTPSTSLWTLITRPVSSECCTVTAAGTVVIGPLGGTMARDGGTLSISTTRVPDVTVLPYGSDTRTAMARAGPLGRSRTAENAPAVTLRANPAAALSRRNCAVLPSGAPVDPESRYEIGSTPGQAGQRRSSAARS